MFVSLGEKAVKYNHSFRKTPLLLLSHSILKFFDEITYSECNGLGFETLLLT